MKVILSQESPSERLLEVTVEAPRLEKALKATFRKRLGGLKIKGFRKGKVPTHIAKRYLTDSVLLGEAVNVLVPQVYKEAIKQEGLVPVGKPELKLVQGERGKDMVFEARFHVMPLLDISGYRGFRIEIPVQKVTPGQVDEALQQMLEPFALYHSRKRSEKAEIGNFLVIDYELEHEGELVPRAALRNFQLELRPGNIMDGFVDQLVGAKADEDRQVKVTLPSDHADLALAGKEVTFLVKIREVKTRQLPELNDDFARKHTKADSLKALRESIKDSLRAQFEKSREDDCITDIIKALLEQVSPEIVPAQLREGHVRLLLQRQTQELAQRGMTMESYLKQRGLAANAYSQEVAISAMIQARLEILYRSIALAEGLQVTNGEVDAKIIEQSKRLGRAPKKLKEQLINEDRYKLLAYQILIEKVRNLLFKEAALTEPAGKKAKSKPKSKAKAKKAKPKSKAKAKKAKPKSKAKAKKAKPKAKATKAKLKSKSKSKAKAKAKPKSKAKA